MKPEEQQENIEQEFYKFSKSQILSALKKSRQSADVNYTTETLPESYYQLDKHPAIRNLDMQKTILSRAGIEKPFFKPYASNPSDTIRCEKREYINFGTYNYLGLCGHVEINNAVKDAVDIYGSSAGSSRLVSGERNIHQQLERAIAKLYDVEDAIVLVSGHATNVTILGHLFSSRDLILYDALIHNSIIQGALLSGAKHLSFPHNDYDRLETILKNGRNQYERVIIVTEGLYSMDGDMPNLHRLVELKKKYKTFLMVDEAHSLGVLGKTGRGLREHFALENSSDVDLWMGTMSKTLASCGGYIAGNIKLIEYLRYTAPGFVYSVGISPPLAAASLKAIELMLNEPERVHNIQKNSQTFLQLAKEHGLNTGYAQGYAVIPIIVGNTIKTMKLVDQLLQNGVVAQPIIYPAVPDKESRVRFFICSEHSDEQIETAVRLTAQLLKELEHDN